jgi:AcrR family transcriptional regulator
MAHDDWLVGRDRGTEATERILNAAADLISRRGYDAFTIDALAAKVHCSPATIYRHVGGKTVIRDAVVAMHANRIVETVRDAISGLSGPDRVVTATAIALERIRSDPLAQIMRSMHSAAESEELLGSPMLAQFAAEMLGHSTPDPLAEQWLIRVFLALWTWPLQESDAERQMLQRFLGPPYGQ